MTIILIIFVISVILSVGAVALVLNLSHRKKWYDHINERKIHTGKVPRLGGIGFACAFFVVTAAVAFLNGEFRANLHFLPCFAAMIIALLSGAYDDFRPMSPITKLISQIIAAICVIVPGFIFEKVLYVGGGFFTNLGLISFPITILWIVGLTNAFNLIDGVDGLAGGLSAIIAFFLGLIFFSYAGLSKSVLLCASLLGVLTGFLVFNAPLPRAKIFMGDSGSQFLGFTLALLPLMKETENPLPVLYAAALFAIPIFDTTAAVWRRIRDGKKIYAPDKSHLHHKLINVGFSVKGVDAIIYSLQIVLGVLVFIAVRLEERPSSLLVLGAAYLVALTFFSIIHFTNRAVNRRKRAADSGGINSNKESEEPEGNIPPPPPSISS